MVSIIYCHVKPDSNVVCSFNRDIFNTKRPETDSNMQKSPVGASTEKADQMVVVQVYHWTHNATGWTACRWSVSRKLSWKAFVFVIKYFWIRWAAYYSSFSGIDPLHFGKAPWFRRFRNCRVQESKPHFQECKEGCIPSTVHVQWWLKAFDLTSLLWSKRCKSKLVWQTLVKMRLWCTNCHRRSTASKACTCTIFPWRWVHWSISNCFELPPILEVFDLSSRRNGIHNISLGCRTTLNYPGGDEKFQAGPFYLSDNF